jgi:hypothetical protein
MQVNERWRKQPGAPRKLKAKDRVKVRVKGKDKVKDKGRDKVKDSREGEAARMRGHCRRV